MTSPETPAGPSSIPPGGDGSAGPWREDMLRELLLEATQQLGELRQATGLDPAGHPFEDDVLAWMHVLVTSRGIRMTPTTYLTDLPELDKRIIALDVVHRLREAADELEDHIDLWGEGTGS